MAAEAADVRDVADALPVVFSRGRRVVLSVDGGQVQWRLAGSRAWLSIENLWPLVAARLEIVYPGDPEATGHIFGKACMGNKTVSRELFYSALEHYQHQLNQG